MNVSNTVVPANPMSPEFELNLPAAAPVEIEVSARAIPAFDTADRARVRFGALEFRSGLVLTSSFRGFGGLSGLRLDPDGERFAAHENRQGLQ